MKAIKKEVGKAMVFLIGMLLTLPALAQTVDSITQQFDRYSMQNLQEKVFVHTDKSFYLAGEIIWFKVYVTDAVFNKPSGISKVGYVEIINKDLKAVLQGKIEISDGSGNGSFMLPSFLASGNYLLRAYTNLMKNIDPGYYFEKSISIVNPLKNAGSFASDSSNIHIGLFPEGGNLVSGLEATVGFHLTDKFGKGVHGNGHLLNQNNDTLLHFTAARFGIGKFTFTPKRGERYKVVVRVSKDKVVTQQLPAVYNEGYVMKVTEADTNNVKIIVRSNLSPVNVTYLFIHARDRFKTLEQRTLINGEAVFVINKKVLGDGINHLTVFDNARRPVSERLYFKRSTKRLEIDVDAQPASFKQRAKVGLALFTHEQNTFIPNADMSVSAFLLDSLQGMDEPGIESYLLLTSNLPGQIEAPDWYLQNNNAEANIAVDNLMLTHGWRRFKWEAILQNQQPYFEYLPEIEGPVVTGKIFDKRTGLPANNIHTYLSAPGQNFQFTTAYSNSKGELAFNIKKFYGSNEMIAQTNNFEDSVYRIDINRGFSDKYSNRSLPPFAISQSVAEQLRVRSINAQAENVYLREQKQRFNLLEDTSHFYAKPAKTYYLDDYTRFTTMEEVMREFVTEVRVRKAENAYNFKVKRPQSLSFFDSDPLVLLDGVPVFNVNKIMELDPLKIKKLDVVTHKFYTGSHVSDGIVSYSSYDGDLAGYQLDASGLVVEYEGLQRAREFYSPQYDTDTKQKSRIPDLRNVLYWSPSVKTDENGRQSVSFYTSDVPGKYAVVVQGITAGGLAGSKVITMDVE